MTGLLWLDDDPRRSLRDKVARAVRRYARKFGGRPAACYVHPLIFGERVSMQVDRVKVRPLATVLPHHFWLVHGEEGQ